MGFHFDFSFKVWGGGVLLGYLLQVGFYFDVSPMV